MCESVKWRTRYARRLRVVDGVVVVWATAGALILRVGTDEGPLSRETGLYLALTAALAVGWWLMLGLWGTRDPKVLGFGPEEYKRVFASSLWLFGIIAILSYSARFDTARGYVGIALPVGVLGLVLGRWILRQHLALERSQGFSSSKVLVLGGAASAEHVVRSLRSHPQAGYAPIGAFLTSNSDERELSVRVIGSGRGLDQIMRAIDKVGADTVAVAAEGDLSPRDLRQLGWTLAASHVSMILAPSLTDVAGPRIHTQPVAGLPLIHVSTPKLTGGRRVAKRAFDIITAVLLLVLLSPVFLLVAVLVRSTSPGPVFYKQERIGIRGTSFNMLKFRSMRTDADQELQVLLRQQGTGNVPLFKVKDDPRITRVGKVLRKYSLDELPQLINVVTGSMSLVGPRPQRAGEVALYDSDAHRRLYVSPGMSGLWQVSGRSNLTWEESIRLDLYYVENWSLVGDIVILLKTFRAVFAGAGAH
ncbi:sugar transferase [Pseudarthrobacter sp. NamE5]|uniref:sugar transferase n=1 Tax=Pseudarthrobacter sp. NamE5 TaxID=2576839 RepID=UPI00110A47DC|nr:sugar transferase [Pseudarthrobacter sp. NamE5]TLM81688.1 sugar transferase [Pseudarthrobacter sp. NamE5]